MVIAGEPHWVTTRTISEEKYDGKKVEPPASGEALAARL